MLVLCSSVARATDLRERLDSLVALDAAAGASWSILFTDLSSGESLLERNADLLLIPASVTKLWTTAAAFSLLGPDYRMVTKFCSSAPLDGGGTLNGNLQVVVGGDPMFEPKSRKDLGRPALDKIADELHGKGLRKVAGNLDITVNRFDRTCGNGVWEMGDLREGFAPAVDGAGYNSNVCHIEIAPGLSEGDPAIVTINPPFAGIKIYNDVLTASPSNESWIEFHVMPCRDELELSGVMARGDDSQYIWFPIQNPALYFGHALGDALKRKGIEVAGQVVQTRDGGLLANTLLEFSSPELSVIASIVNKESDNYLAEYLLSAIGLQQYGEGNTDAGLRGVQKFARELGIRRDQFSLQDGCGLSRQNIVSARAIVDLLAKMGKGKNADGFEASLSHSGMDGTLSGRLSTEGMLGRVRAKTGTMTHVSALAGYMALDDGRRVAFAILANNFRCSPHYVRNIQDTIVRAVYRAAN
ncbi:MAG: D-alanyl-D-alanine carboxypeptidase/D-alanyl-D-alanine-endopeptidase [bacterium]|nr:D-alanyl-D-alanine carboxypeptidase/D-alanyl-D-alanine-endopeptidase [bacterium]